MSDEQRAVSRSSAAREKRPRTPLWVRIFGLAGLGLVIAFVILHLTGNGMVWH